MMNENHPSIAVVGAGLAGLAATWRVRQQLPNATVTLCEASDRVGGILQTELTGGYLLEQAADMFTTDPDDALEVCRLLGRESDLITTKSVAQRACVATETGIAPVPRGFSLMLPGDLEAIRASGILDDAGFRRLLTEEQVSAADDRDRDEDFRSFVTRRLGQPAFDRLVQPLVSGIYTADPSKLSMRATMQRFLDMEREHGSLIAAAKAAAVNSPDRTASGARYDLFRAPAGGMGMLPKWLLEAAEATDVRLGWPVAKIEKQGETWTTTSSDERHAPLDSDAVIIATPVARAAQLLSPVSRKLSNELEAIESASCAVVVLAFDESQLRRPFSGYGIVIPAFLNRDLIAASFSSNKFAGRAPEGKVLIRCFLGGAMRGELVDLPDQQLIATAVSELDRLVGIAGQPELERVYRWRNAMPQYHVGHLDRVAAIESAVGNFQTLGLAGNGYRGVGIPVCLRSGVEAADKIIAALDAEVTVRA